MLAQSPRAKGMEENAKSIARPAASRSLREAIRTARLEEAEHLDRTADLRDSEIARLELLKADLETVFIFLLRKPGFSGRGMISPTIFSPADLLALRRNWVQRQGPRAGWSSWGSL